MMRRTLGIVALSLWLVGLGSVVAAAAPIYAQGESATVLEPYGSVTTKAWPDYHLSGAFLDGTKLYVKEPVFTVNSYKAYGGTYTVKMRHIGLGAVSSAASAKIDLGQPVAFVVHAENTVLTQNFTGGLDWNVYPPDWCGFYVGGGLLATVPGSARLKYGTGTVNDLASAEQVQWADEIIDPGGYKKYQSVTFAGTKYDLDSLQRMNARFEAEVIAKPTGTPAYDASGNYTGSWVLNGRVGYALGSASMFGWQRFSGVTMTTANLKTLRAEGAPFLPVGWRNASRLDSNSAMPLGFDVNKEANSSLVQTYYGCWLNGADTITKVQALIDGSTAFVTDAGVDKDVADYTGTGGTGIGLPPATIPGSIDDTSSAPSLLSNKWVTYLQDTVTNLGSQLSGLLWPLHVFTDLMGG